MILALIAGTSSTRGTLCLSADSLPLHRDRIERQYPKERDGENVIVRVEINGDANAVKIERGEVGSRKKRSIR
jgi:hypothetical protein